MPPDAKNIGRFFQATSLPFIVAGTQIGLALGAIQQSTASAFVAAGLVSVVCFPTVGLAMIRGREAPPYAMGMKER